MKSTILLILPLLALCSCSATGGRKALNYGLGAGAGTAAGYGLSDGDPLWTAAGAVGGIALAAGANALQDKENEEAVMKGYTAGKVDAIKSHYWMLQANQERNDAGGYGVTNTYDVVVPGGVDPEGIRRVPRHATIRIVE
jgi:hypothetical protein